MSLVDLGEGNASASRGDHVLGHACAGRGVPTAHAAFPGANGKIAFEGISAMDSDGSGQTHLADLATDPAWSPDGTKIAYVHYGHIYSMNADGSNQTLLDGGYGDEAPAWSPDGSKILFARSSSSSLRDIYSMNADGSGVTLVASRGTDPAWSPDGSKIAFAHMTNCSPSGSCSTEDTMDIYLMNPDGTGQVDITNRRLAGEFSPQWSPDGTKIVFAYNALDDPEAGGDPFYDLGVINPDGTGWANLTSTASPDELAPQWSPDGQKMLFFVPYDRIYIMDPDGNNRTAVGPSTIGPTPTGSRCRRRATRTPKAPPSLRFARPRLQAVRDRRESLQRQARAVACDRFVQSAQARLGARGGRRQLAELGAR